MLKGKGKPIENTRQDTNVIRCGHNFEIATCPYRYCAARAMLKALVTIDRQAMSCHPIGHDAIVAVRAALRMAGLKPAPEGLWERQS